MKKLKISALLVIFVFCILLFSSCEYAFIQSYYEVNEDLPDNLTSGKSLAEYAVNTVEEDSGKEFNVGEVYMILDPELKGEVKVTLVEKKQRKPLLVYVDFDTKSNKLLSFNYNGWHSKLDPGIINFQDWKIDHTEAIEISERFFSEADGFRYDRVLIYSCNSHPFKDEYWEDWSVSLYDDKGKKKYYTRIDPYTGEILRHSISEYFSP